MPVGVVVLGGQDDERWDEPATRVNLIKWCPIFTHHMGLPIDGNQVDLHKMNHFVHPNKDRSGMDHLSKSQPGTT